MMLPSRVRPASVPKGSTKCTATPVPGLSGRRFAVPSFAAPTPTRADSHPRRSVRVVLLGMALLAAANVGILDRGLIRSGMAADLVLFDPETVLDRATPEDPLALSVGIEAVRVNGELVWEGTSPSGARPGSACVRTLRDISGGRPSRL